MKYIFSLFLFLAVSCSLKAETLILPLDSNTVYILALEEELAAAESATKQCELRVDSLEQQLIRQAQMIRDLFNDQRHLIDQNRHKDEEIHSLRSIINTAN